jgi:hypothetical protein
MTSVVLTSDHVLVTRFRAELRRARVPYQQRCTDGTLTEILVDAGHRRLAVELLERIYDAQPWRRLSIPRRYLLVRDNRGLLAEVAKQHECSAQAVGQVWRGLTASRPIEAALSRAYLAIAPPPAAVRSN